MPYRRLSKEQLQVLPQKLKKFTSEYPSSHSAERYAFNELVDYLTEKTAEDKSLSEEQQIELWSSLYLFQIEILRHERLLPSWSTTFRFLNTELGISLDVPNKNHPANILSEHENVGFLRRLLSYIDEHFTEQDLHAINSKLAAPHWKSKKELRDAIHAMLGQVVKRDEIHIKEVLHATATLPSLRKYMARIPHLYQTEKENRAKKNGVFGWIGSTSLFSYKTEREKAVNLIAFLDKACYQIYNSSQDDASELLQKIECKARKGIILFNLLKISRTHHAISPNGGYVTNGSALFIILLGALSTIIKSADELDFDWQIDWLKTLSELIDEIENKIKTGNIEDKKFQEYKKFYEQAVAEWGKLGMGEFATTLKNLKDEIQECIGYVEKLKHTPGWKEWGVTTSVTWGAETGILAVGAFLIKQFGAFAFTSGPIGMMVFAAIIFLTGLGKTAGSALFAWMREKISVRVGEKAGSLVKETFEESKEGFDKLWAKLTLEEQKNLQIGINELLAVPDDIFSEENKKSIRHVVGLEVGEKFEPFAKINHQPNLPSFDSILPPKPTAASLPKPVAKPKSTHTFKMFNEYSPLGSETSYPIIELDEVVKKEASGTKKLSNKEFAQTKEFEDHVTRRNGMRGSKESW